jgi:Fe2+ transport system protein FeoA
METLASLRPGECAQVLELVGDDPITVRLYEMGLLPGERVTFLGKAPLGDPLAVRVRGSRLALRRAEALRVQIRRLPGADAVGAVAVSIPGSVGAAASSVS